MTEERTHANLKIGVAYPQGYDLIYILQRAKKGETPTVAAQTVQLPPQLSLICNMKCGLLKGKPCTNHVNPGKVALPAFVGENASMLSFVAARISPHVENKESSTIWMPRISQVTSRSINHAIYADRARHWDEATAEIKNTVINGVYSTVWDVLSQKESKSAQLRNVAVSAEDRAQKLFKKLLTELSGNHSDARWATGRHGDQEIANFENPHTFLAGLSGANSQYSSYSTHTPAQLAFLHEQALIAGRRVNPELVKEIMGCYQKVKEAEKYETQPYTWDQKTVEKAMLSSLFKPEPAEAVLPF